MIAIAGTIGAVLFAFWGLSAIPSLSLPGGVDLGRIDLSIDWRVLGAATVAAILTLVSAASLPITRFTRTSLASELLAGPAATPTVSSHRLRQTLLALHVCMTIVVLVAAGLFLRAVQRACWTGPGFDMDHSVFVRLRVAPRTVNLGAFDAWKQANMERTARVREALRQLPGVGYVADGAPPIGSEASATLGPRVVEASQRHAEVLLGMMSGSPDLVSALILWRDENPLGQLFSLSGRGGGHFLVVGIAQDFIFGSFNRPAAAAMVTIGQDFGDSLLESDFVIQTAYTVAINERIRKVVNEVLPGMPPPTISTGRDIVERDIGGQRLGAWFFSGFGLTALLLGVIGVFGLVAYLAESRQREFGVRLAFGAT
jgi:hypothetical protein